MVHNDYVSLLHGPCTSEVFILDEKSMKDIDLSYIDGMYEDGLSEWLKKTMSELPMSVDCVQYRQAILKDFINNPGLLQVFNELSKEFFELKNMIKFAFERDNTLYNVLKRVEESEQILKGMYRIRDGLKAADVKSAGLKNFLSLIVELMDSDLFRAYEKDLKSIQSKEQIRGMKIGLNLDQDMNPVEAIILTLEEEAFIYTRPLKRVYRILSLGVSELKKVPRRIFAPETVIPKENLTALEKVIEPAMAQLLKFIDTFNDSLLDVFEPLKEEMAYYHFGYDLYKSIKDQGHPLCQVIFSDEGQPEIRDLYNMNLAYHFIESKEKMVYNNLRWMKQGQMYLLTGANRGGKTTLTQSIAQVYWLGLLGYYVPASYAKLPMIDGLYVHFPSEESETVLYGRLGEECQRFSDIFQSLTPRSVLLMNESFSGTSHLESVTIARESLRALAEVGCAGLFNTHLHELALTIDELNESINHKYCFVNLVAGSKTTPQSFKVAEGEPLGKSYAHEIAIKYGVSFNQLVSR